MLVSNFHELSMTPFSLILLTGIPLPIHMAQKTRSSHISTRMAIATLHPARTMKIQRYFTIYKIELQ